MVTEIEISSLDLRYENHRMKNPGLEGKLLASILQNGIQEPLEGVNGAAETILLNGFKRYRCARQLHIETVPYLSLGQEEGTAIVNLLRTSLTKTLSFLEQAAFVDELQHGQAMSVAEIATELSRSKAWVSMRLGLMAEVSPTVRQKLFEGSFPAYCYMSTLRSFMRINRVPATDIEAFVSAVSGRGLSVRDIEQLAHGFFRGPESFRQEILKGNIAWSLNRMKEAPADAQDCSDFENSVLRDLEILQKYIQRVMGKSLDPRLKSRAFHAQCQLLTAGILSRNTAFIQTVRNLHDRSGQA